MSIVLSHILVSKKGSRMGLLVLLLATVSTVFGDLPDSGMVITVNGPVSPDVLGAFLPHEHVMSTFGATEEQAATYDREIAYEKVHPYLRKLKSLGLKTLAECTGVGFGRDPLLLKMLSDSVGVHLLANTGYYAAAKDRYVPQNAYGQTAEQIADVWTAESERGIGQTGIRPGFIKIGIDTEPLSEIDAKIVRAAAITHPRTGLTIAAHTSKLPQAVSEQIAILKEEGVHPSAWIWVHAQNMTEPADLLRAAGAGAWIELDGIRDELMDRHLSYVKTLKEAGFLSQILLSHDGNSMRITGRAPKAYEQLFTTFIPLLLEEGFTKQEVRQLTETNPAVAFTVSKRLLTR
jgi:predicted metal-dependent phosphotriesterase family hydrolase